MKITSEGKLRPILALSWLVRAQIGAKRGKLTLLGGLRGTKLALKGNLERPRRPQKAPQRVMQMFDPLPDGVVKELSGPPKVT